MQEVGIFLYICRLLPCRSPLFHGSPSDLLGLTLWFFAVAILPEILIAMLVLRPVLAAKMRRENLKAVLDGEWDEAIKRIVSPLQEDLEGMRAEIGTAEPAAFQEDLAGLRQEWQEFAELVGKDLEVVKTIPQAVRMEVLSMQGVEQRQIQALMEEAGGDLEAQAKLLEHAAEADPEAVAARLLQKIANWEPSTKWKAEHEFLAFGVEAVKPVLIDNLQGMLLGTGRTVQGKQGRDRKALPNPYGR